MFARRERILSLVGCDVCIEAPRTPLVAIFSIVNIE